MSKLLTDAELMQIVENDDFWKKLSQTEEHKSGVDAEIVEVNDKLNDVENILNAADESEHDECDQEEISEDNSESQFKIEANI